MIVLIPFAFIAGVVTVLSPCILPVLPIVLSGSFGGRLRPVGIIVGFIASFTFFTLFLSTLVRITGLSADWLRTASILIIFSFGLALVVPAIQKLTEQGFQFFSSKTPQTARPGFWGGVGIGFSLGLLWTPCVGPILAAVISLALTGSVSGGAVAITFSYAAGTAIPLFIIMQGGQGALRRFPWIVQNTARIQRVFGVIMILTAIGIFLNVDRSFQAFFLNTFPRYGTGLTQIEDVGPVRAALDALRSPQKDPQQATPKGKPAPALIPGGEWFNSEPLTLEDLRGKVVLIDFWTYTCINCIRTLPYLKDWDRKYRDAGLVIIGVHSPEFEFEKSPQNVEAAIADYGLTYPVMQDNDFATWRAYDNRYWPAKYLIDKDGIIRTEHFGEGGYDEMESWIQQLLMEAGGTVSSEPISNPSYRVAARTPETYLGYARLQFFASPEKVLPDKPQIYTVPKTIPHNQFAYSGTWTIGSEYARSTSGSSLISAFEAASVYLVMRPVSKPATVRVYVDDILLTDEQAGIDVVDGIITVNQDRLYRLLDLPSAGRHILRLEFPHEPVEVFAFTFG